MRPVMRLIFAFSTTLALCSEVLLVLAGVPDVACAALTASLGFPIVQSSGAQYEATATGSWNLFNDGYRPACIVYPINAIHVQTAMTHIFSTGSQYAVQSGGHTAMIGWNTVEGGILIVFSNMANVSYDAISDTITLQPGVHWDDAYAALAPYGVAPVGGRQGDVGTGLILGGGLSFLSPAHGFAADSIKEADVVLTNGTLITTNNENDHADLLRALKGSANRFGIVTRYELYAVHTGTALDLFWYGGSITYGNSSIEAVLAATAHFISTNTDPKAVLLLFVVTENIGDVITPSIGLDIFYNGPSLPPSIFGQILAIPSLAQSLSPLSYYNITNVLPSGAARGNGQHYGASALIGSYPLFLNAFTHWTNFTNTFISELEVSVLAFTPVLQPQIDAGRARGGNAIDPPDGPYAAIQLSQQFPATLTSISPELRQGIDLLFEQIPPSPGKPLFMNECDQNQEVFATYGDYAWLKETYLKYDPTRFNVEHIQGPIGL